MFIFIVSSDLLLIIIIANRIIQYVFSRCSDVQELSSIYVVVVVVVVVVN